jgi:hypothetical protein
MGIDTVRWWGCQPHAPAAFTSMKCSWYSFSITNMIWKNYSRYLVHFSWNMKLYIAHGEFTTKSIFLTPSVAHHISRLVSHILVFLDRQCAPEYECTTIPRSVWKYRWQRKRWSPMGWTYLARCGEVLTRGEGSRTAVGKSDRHNSATNHRMKQQTFRVACSERVDCTNAFRRVSGNLSFNTKIFACASISFRTGTIFLAVNYVYGSTRRHVPKYSELQPHRCENWNLCLRIINTV